MVYTVFLTQAPGKPWRATVPGLPDCEAEAPSRAEALDKIRQRIAAVAGQTEVLRLQVAAAPKTAGEPPPEFTQTPWSWFGVFQDDPTWTTLFADIEQHRDLHLVGK